MKKIFISAISILLVLFISVLAFAAPSRSVGFSDVGIDSWYYEAVNYVYSHGVMVGIGGTEFAPDTAMNRAMVVAVLARLVNADLTDCTETGFSDVDIDAWYGKSVVWAQKNGIVAGMSKTEFAPFAEITREQICVMLSNFFDYLGLSTANIEKEPFADADSISAWAEDEVLRLQKAGIINGKEENLFDPQGSATRAEFAQIVLNSNLATLISKEETPNDAEETPETETVPETEAEKTPGTEQTTESDESTEQTENNGQ